MTKEFRIYVHDDASPTPEAIAMWFFDAKDPALMYARELCDKFQENKDCLRNLSRYSVTVYQFYGTDLKFRSDVFDSKKEYPCVR
tara:strand:- start:4504 stop:4758 length:255 start_codon:yes stop_codon:yes gene_type:complete